MSSDKQYTGTITIWGGKVRDINLGIPGQPELLEITKVLAVKQMLEKFLDEYEKNYKRT